MRVVLAVLGFACAATACSGSAPQTASAAPQTSAGLTPALHSVTQEETPAQRDKRMQWFREARFGMFIHWGVYAVPAGEWQGRAIGGIGEWIMNSAQIPIGEYEKFVPQFNPVRFDAREWVRIAKDAGMKYIVITSKHHDGFCMFDAKNSQYDIMATPFGRDVIKELARACKTAGIRLCFYHSIMDWHHPDYLPRRPWDKRPTDTVRFERYVEYMKEQLRQLVSDYGPLGIMWFDGEWESTWTHEHGKDLYAYVRSLQPSIIVNNRVDKGRRGMEGMTATGEFAGDYGTPEQEVPATGLPGVDWESCMTMNDTWGFKKADQNWKSGPDLIRMLVDCASKGGNLLLNVGPTAEGLIPQPSVERLAEVGSWMKRNSESVYGTSASPIGRPSWGRCTAKANRLYLHVFDWPSDRALRVEGLTARPTAAYALGARRSKLGLRQEGGSWVIAIPREPTDTVNSVIVVETSRR